MPPGLVSLIGAGPGDPGLITVRGLERLRAAEFVLADRLSPRPLLAEVPADAEVVLRPETHPDRAAEQAELIGRMIAESRAGRRVVRLKGGDPLVFGRGGEEAEGLAAAGVPFEVIPGVTSAFAAGSLAGIPLTHRDRASCLTLVTGHENPEKPTARLDYGGLVRTGGTLVFYMAAGRLATVAARLREAGMPPGTPAAFVRHASHPHQRTTRTTLAGLAGLPDRRLPAVLILGDAAAEPPGGRGWNWWESRPLAGLRVAFTRPEGRGDEQERRLRDLGAEPFPLPLIEIVGPESWDPVDAAIAALPRTDWLVFTSANGVRGFLDRLCDTADPRALGGVKLAAVGPSTAAVLDGYRLRADLVPEDANSEGLAAALTPLARGKRVVWAGADRGRDVLPDRLAAAGATVEKVICYRHRDVPDLTPEVRAALVGGELDWVCLSSGRSAERYAELTAGIVPPHPPRLAALSPVTAAAAAAAGLRVDAVAGECSWDGLFAVLCR